MPKQTFYRVSLETSHFTFEAFAETPEQARRLLRRAVVKHCSQTGADRAYMLDGEADWQVDTLTLGTAYRDGAAQ